MPTALLAALNRPVAVFGTRYTLRRLVELDGKWFAVVVDAGGREVHVSAAWCYPIA